MEELPKKEASFPTLQTSVFTAPTTSESLLQQIRPQFTGTQPPRHGHQAIEPIPHRHLIDFRFIFVILITSRKRGVFTVKRLIILLLILCLLCGCGADSLPPATQSTTAAPETTTTVTEPTTTTAPVTTQPHDPVETSITLSFVGDCTLGTNQKHTYPNSFHAYYDKKGPHYFLSKVRHIFENDDLTVVNLEGSLTNSTDLVEKMWNHKGPPEYVSILTTASVEVATMGNNHRLDYGVSGCTETEQVLTEAGIGYCYDGNYLIKEVKGIKIGFVSVNEHYDGQAVMTWLEEGYHRLRAQGCALVIACVHWGQDYQVEMDAMQLEMGNQLIDLGYDLVIGNHPHVLQAMRIYKGKFICYSLGNFCYGGNKNPDDKDSGIFRQTFTFLDGVLQYTINAQFIPCHLSGKTDKNNYRPTPASGKEFDRIIQKVNSYSDPFGFAWDENGTLILP